ncbi:hypothetical protein ACLMJK_005112 [Lecanora helva]
MFAAPPQTPQRPLPGAYVQTPAANRNFQSGLINQPNLQPRLAVAQQQQQHGSQGQTQALSQQRPQEGQAVLKPPTEELRPVERASRTINQSLEQESRYPALDTYVSQISSSDYDIGTQTAWAPFQKIKSYNIPDSVFAQINNAKLSTKMGLFADLNHAWVSIDNAFYLWDYTHPNPELIGFEQQQTHNITAVQLVTPRAGVFLPTINRLLVIATTVELLLVGLASQPATGGGQAVTLFSTNLSVPVKGISVNVIEGSAATGRVFFSERGSDDVFEITYQQEERWFQNRCAKINHTGKGVNAFNPGPIFGFGQKPQGETIVQMAIDDTRSLLYTLTSQSTIRVFHMRANNVLTLMITKTLAAILVDIRHTPSSSTDLLGPSIPIISISPISAQESERSHLVAITSTGCRVFMSATSGHSMMSSSNAPTSMQLQFIKFPPVNVSGAAGSQQNSTQVSVYGQNNQGTNMTSRSLVGTRSAVRYAPGYFFCLVKADAGIDSLFISASDAGRIARSRDNLSLPRYPELGLWSQLGSTVEAMGLASSPQPASRSPTGFGNELTVQYDGPAAEVALLTNTGVHTYRRKRLVDIFAAAIKFGGGDEGLEGQINKFLRWYGPGETASTALAVACGQGLDVTPESRVAKITDPMVLEFARKAFIEHGGKPSFNDNQIIDQSMPSIDAVRPSPRHAGLALYLARLVRSIWKSVIMKQTLSPTSGLLIIPAVSMVKLREISQSLVTLKEFLIANKSFIDGLAGPDALGRATTKQDEVALQAEHRALYSLLVLIEDIIEGIAFVNVLFDEQITEIMKLLPSETQQQMLNLKYEDLFSTTKGKDLAKELVKAIVNRNIANGSNVETVAEALRRRCGTFCSADDVVVFKAQELLKRSSEAGGESESGRNLLNESLRLFKQVARTLTVEQLQWAVQSFTNLHFYAGAIQLALDVAHESDRGNRALSWIQDGRLQQDSRATAFDARKRCYNLVHEVITNLEQDSTQAPSVVDGQYTLAAKRRTEAYEVIDNSDDEAFQTDLYDWYLSQGRTDRLLDIQSPYIVSYLQRRSVDDVGHADLLWRYHVQHGHNHEAAEVQLELARSTFPLTLDRRIEYLGRAKANASTTSPGVARHIRYKLLREVSDLLDVANIQSDLLQRLREDERISAARRPEVVETLNGSMLPVSVLYNEYADQAGYFDICLLIYQAADHRNPNDIRNTWQNLLEQTHEETVARGEPQPYEAISEKVRSLGTRLNLSETMFPINDMVPILERYAFEYQNGVGPETWVMDVCIDVSVPFESLFAVLEGMFYNDEAPFQGRNRRYIANELIYIVGLWFQESSRGAGKLLGGESNAAAVSQVLQTVQPTLDARRAEECQTLRMRIEYILR